MRNVLFVLAALVIGCGPVPPAAATDTSSSEPEVLAQLSLFYKRKRWEDPVECPSRSKLALHGECWQKVDVEIELKKCSRTTPVTEDDTVPQDPGTCPEIKPIFRFGFV
ncbi:MAG TPA: hypothetical protein VF815_27825 [Myxococcaceae bacterium]|jgi:hypothetical protein